MIKLKFAKGNAKLGKNTAIFSLPAGHSCVGAQDCLARANRLTGKIADGAKTQFRCYAASSENLFRNVRVSRWNNFDALKGKSQKAMADLIAKSLPKNISLCRIHASGDFFSQTYFDAWCDVARAFPDVIFYAYTKSLPFWLYRKGAIPANLHLNASKGGKFDAMIDANGLKFVQVVFTEKQAEQLGIAIDHDDKLAWCQDKSFALLLHGTQPAGTPQAKALAALRGENKGGYKADYFAHYDKQKTKVVK